MGPSLQVSFRSTDLWRGRGVLSASAASGGKEKERVEKHRTFKINAVLRIWRKREKTLILAKAGK